MKKFRWRPGHTILLYQIPLLIALPFYFLYATPPSLGLILISILIFTLAEISITAGYHRLYAHKAYKTKPIIELFFVFFASMSCQKSVLRWAFEHRCHHAFVDTDRDPYSVIKGFWHAHFLWFFDEPQEIDPKMVADLLKKKLLVFQDKYEDCWMLIPNFLVTFLVGWYFQDYIGAVVVCLGLRLFFNHHCTFFINSLAHTYGSRPFDKNITAVNNYFISIPTFGEGFHNFHHAFPQDYRNGVRWFDFDPTKWLIWILHKCRLASDVKQVSAERIKEELLKEESKV